MRLTSCQTVWRPRAHRLVLAAGQVGLDPDQRLVDLLPVHDDVAVLVAAQHVVDADDALLVLVLGVADQRGAHLHPRVSATSVEEPEVRGHDLTLLDHCKIIVFQ